MDTSSIAIAQAIAGLDCDEEIKNCLRKLFNEELAPSSTSAVPQSFYVRQVEAHAENWNPSQDGDE
jgi:hypothetical protein